MADNAQYIVDEASLQSTQNFLIQFLKDSGYEGSVENGTAIFDTVIKPFSLLFSLFSQEVELKAKAYLSLSEAERLKDSLGDEYDVVVDAILSNWFVARKGGTSPKVTLRLIFSQPVAFMELKKEQIIAKIQGVGFYPVETTTLYKDSFTSIIHDIENSLVYYVDVEAESREILALSPVNMPSTDVTGTIPGIYFLRAELASVVSPGTMQEDSDAFIKRTQDAITTRELISDKAQKTVLLNEFDGLKDLYVAGHGDPEQTRDIVDFQSMAIHVGNKKDIFLQSKITEVTLEIELGADLAVDLAGKAVLGITRIKDVETGGTRTWTVALWDAKKVGSLYDSLSLFVAGASTGDSIFVTYLTSSFITGPTAFIEAEDQRVGCFDPIVKEKFPIVLECSLQVQYDPDALATSTLADLETKVKDVAVEYVLECSRTSAFSVSSLISYLHTNLDFIKRVNTPMEVAYSLTDPADFSVHSGAIDSVFNLPVGLSPQMTSNTIQMFTNKARINVSWA